VLYCQRAAEKTCRVGVSQSATIAESTDVFVAAGSGTELITIIEDHYKTGLRKFIIFTQVYFYESILLYMSLLQQLEEVCSAVRLYLVDIILLA
jgi:hypothetical protein